MNDPTTTIDFGEGKATIRGLEYNLEPHQHFSMLSRDHHKTEGLFLDTWTLERDVA
ncbi:unnamed protein product [Dovyalis caffra]|uniref:Uncharacterized protein n=1 Tax=Dovyalis caffra TaxID=77055 RepID=A0AAV1S1S8_9ROSI|nr:unnamed protein product [Dovyalis caffra]